MAGETRVRVRSVPQLPTTQASIADVEAAAPHTLYSYQELFVKNAGLLQAEPAGLPDDPSEILRWSSGSMQLIVPWIAERIADIPVLPDMDSTDANEVLLDYELGMYQTELMPDGVNHIYRVTGCYIYAILAPRSKKTGYPMGAAPPDKTASSTVVVRSQNFRPVRQ